MQKLFAKIKIRNALIEMFKNSEIEKGFKMVRKILLAILLLNLTFTQLNAYDGKAAAKYALKYVYNHNPAYRYYGGDTGGDCTNFVSQALKAGGMTIDSRGYYNWQKWTKYSPSWQMAPDLEERFRRARYSNGRKVAKFITGKEYGYYEVIGNISNIKVGDIIFFDWDNEDGMDDVSPVIVHFTHSVIVTENYGYGLIYVTYHSYDTKYRQLGYLTIKADRWRCYRPISMY